MTGYPFLLRFSKHLDLREGLLKRGALRGAAQGELVLFRFKHALLYGFQAGLFGHGLGGNYLSSFGWHFSALAQREKMEHFRLSITNICVRPLC